MCNNTLKLLESIQHNPVLAITGVIRRTTRDKLYYELGLESLQDRRWYRTLCMCFFYKILDNISHKDLSDIIRGPPEDRLFFYQYNIYNKEMENIKKSK